MTMEDNQCSICMMTILYPELISTKCHHIFHIKCLKTWLNNCNNNCPICRRVAPWTNFIPDQNCSCQFYMSGLPGLPDLPPLEEEIANRILQEELHAIFVILETMD